VGEESGMMVLLPLFLFSQGEKAAEKEKREE
jgi:hypothetical protein